MVPAGYFEERFPVRFTERSVHGDIDEDGGMSDFDGAEYVARQIADPRGWREVGAAPECISYRLDDSHGSREVCSCGDMPSYNIISCSSGDAMETRYVVSRDSSEVISDPDFSEWLARELADPEGWREVGDATEYVSRQISDPGLGLREVSDSHKHEACYYDRRDSCGQFDESEHCAASCGDGGNTLITELDIGVLQGSPAVRHSECSSGPSRHVDSKRLVYGRDYPAGLPSESFKHMAFRFQPSGRRLSSMADRVGHAVGGVLSASSAVSSKFRRKKGKVIDKE